MRKELQSPTCVGFIMDGNRRWAKERDLDTLEGHQKGHDAFVEIVRLLRESDIEHGIFYAFSTENWNRSEREVSYLLRLFQKDIDRFRAGVEEEKVRVRIVGERSRFPESLQESMDDLEAKTEQYEGTTIWIALSYGGRAELLAAVNKAIQNGGHVSEESFSKLLWTTGMPDPDLIIRTSGEQRLSNFLPWQSVYSELFFTDTYWPDFGRKEFESILEEYGNRVRRKGK